jgi:hypothetical protein
LPLAAVPLFVWKPDQYYISIGLARDNTAVPTDTLNRTTNTNILPPEEVRFYPRGDPYRTGIQYDEPYRQGVYHIEDFLRGINEALQAVWAQIVNTNPWLFVTGAIDDTMGSAVTAPRLGFSTAQNRFYFQLPLRADGLTVPGALNPLTNQPMFYHGLQDLFPTEFGLRIYMSTALYSLFNGFPAYDFGPAGVVDDSVGTRFNRLNYGLNLHYDRASQQTLIAQSAGIPSVANNLPYPYQVTYQEQTSVFAWNRVARILVASSMGFVKETLVSSNRKSGTPDAVEVLTDFAVEQSNTASANEYLYFADNSSTRYIDTKATGVLNRIDIRIEVEFDDGTKAPLYLLPGSEVNLKMAFDRKPHNHLLQISETSRHTFEN